MSPFILATLHFAVALLAPIMFFCAVGCRISTFKGRKWPWWTVAIISTFCLMYVSAVFPLLGAALLVIYTYDLMSQYDK